MGLPRRILKVLASLRLTVVLFACAMFLIFAGTLAQVNEGVWTVVARYFRSLYVVIPFQVFVPASVGRVPGAMVFPGGFAIVGAMLVNLLAAHAVRFKLSVTRLGIIVAHLGVILLLVGEFVTGIAAVEGNMTIDAGGTADFVEDIRRAELAVIDSSGSSEDIVVVVPERRLTHAEGGISHALLPFQIRVDQWMPNSRLMGPMEAPASTRTRADSGFGLQVAAVPAAAATGVEGAAVDVPSAYITLSEGGRRLGSYLVSVYIDQPQTVVANGKPYDIELRFKRTYKPYTVHLLEFKHDKFTGTETPRNFSSRVRLVDPGRGVDREALIWMNHPLRHAGETMYQAAFKKGDTGTILQVVRNPAWLIPYVSCAMVCSGMLLHFGLKLGRRPGRRR